MEKNIQFPEIDTGLEEAWSVGGITSIMEDGGEGENS